MSKRERDRGVTTPSAYVGGRSSENFMWPVRIAMLAGLAILIYMNATALREARAGRKEQGDRLVQLDGRVTQLTAKMDAIGRQQPPRSGPDPNRVYPIKTDGSAAQGPATAQVVIAEFSDFQ